MHSRWRISLIGLATATALATTTCPSLAQQTDEPPGSPGVDNGYAPSDKQGVGTSYSTRSPVWFTLGHGGSTELYYPNLSTPASRQLQIVVSDGATFAQRLSDVPTRTERTDERTPSYRQVSTGDGWTATTTYTTDPARAAVSVDLNVQSHNGKPLQTYAIHEPTLSADGADDRSRSDGDSLVASDGSAASALLAKPGFTASSSGYLGTSDGWTDLNANKKLTAQYPKAGPGHVGQVGQLPVDGLGNPHAVLTLGYGQDEAEARATAESTAKREFAAVQQEYRDGWDRYLGSLKPPPASVAADEHRRSLYFSSLAMLAASEDKQNRGAFVASPSMPWAFGTDKDMAPEPGPYHLVWPRDLYQHATALLAAGDRAAADRSWDYLMSVQQSDGQFPQNTKTTGEPHWKSVQLDETGLPLVLAWQLGRTDPASLDSVRKGAEFLVSFEKDGHRAPWSEQERWENQSGYSPGTIAAAISGLVCAADLLERSGDAAAAEHYRAIADDWAKKVDGWTATSTGPHSPDPYYLRVSKEGTPDSGTRYNPGDNYPEEVDERTQVDPSFLELVRLGVKRTDDPIVTNSIAVIDRVLGEDTPSGQFWHRFTNDGFGERADGAPWNIGEGRTYGRLWPIFAGERGEYELLAGDSNSADKRLGAMAATANEGQLLPEQVWDNRKPAGAGGPRPGTPTTSATPLTWTHGQYVRLAWSLDAGAPVEQPSVVAERYAGR